MKCSGYKVTLLLMLFAASVSGQRIDGKQSFAGVGPAYQGGTISWTRSGQSVTFDVTASFRLSDLGPVSVGSLVDVGSDFNYGDGSPAEDARLLILTTVASSDVAYGRLVRASGQPLVHTYSGVGPFEAFWEGGNRLPNATNFSTSNWRSEISVNLSFGITQSPLSSLSFVVIANDNNIVGFNIPYNVFDNAQATISVGTAADFVATPSNPAEQILPAGMTISTTGSVTWDIRDSVRPAVTAGQVYYAAFRVVSSNGISIPLEFIVQVEPDANQAPINTVPGAQNVSQNGTLLFDGANQIFVQDPDGQGGNLTVTMTVQHGTLTLSGTSGLTFSVGDGTADQTMTMTGTPSSLLFAMFGMTYSPTIGYYGTDSFTILTNDNGNTGGPALSDADSFQINVLRPSAANVSISGRVLAANGRSIGGALVEATQANGNVLHARTNSFGYYRLTNIPSGELLVLTVSARRYSFAQPTRILFLSDDVADADFIANP